MRRFGWVYVPEPKPSYNRHYVPGGKHIHLLHNECWCKPQLHGEKDHTVVIHTNEC